MTKTTAIIDTQSDAGAWAEALQFPPHNQSTGSDTPHVVAAPEAGRKVASGASIPLRHDSAASLATIERV